MYFDEPARGLRRRHRRAASRAILVLPAPFTLLFIFAACAADRSPPRDCRTCAVPVSMASAAMAFSRTTNIDSTNEEARRLRRAGDAGPLWIIGARQTAGRGRRGREWDSRRRQSRRDAAASGPASRRAECAQLSFAAAIAVVDMLARFRACRRKFAVKWPNDVLADGRKIAGILLESASGRRGAGLAGHRHRRQSLDASLKDTEFPPLRWPRWQSSAAERR